MARAGGPPSDPVNVSHTSPFPLMDRLPEGHLVRMWWEGRLPSLPEGIEWPRRPDAVALQRLRDEVDHGAHGPLLVEVIRGQYADAGLPVPARCRELGRTDCRTVTTGHQLCIAGGPAFTFHKIQTALTLAGQLERRWGTPVVPVFWLASEDHDFEEVSRLWDGVQWSHWSPEGPIGGAVGRMRTDGLDRVLEAWGESVGIGGNMGGLTGDGAEDLSVRMRRWVHAVFGPDRLLVVDGDHPRLKQAFAAIMMREVAEGFVEESVGPCNAAIERAGHRPQVHVRPCNLFHLHATGRHRITPESGAWLSTGGTRWEQDALLRDIAEHPGDFSPNALLRPVYQSCLLPDVAVVGGLAEVAYGLQLPAVFRAVGRPQPVLVPRDGAVVLPPKWSGLMDRCGLTTEDLDAPLDRWRAKVVEEAGTPDVSSWLSAMREHAALASRDFSRLDPTLGGSVQAALVKMEQQIERLDQLAARSVRRKEEDTMKRLERLHGWVQPDGQPQERVAHFLHLEAEWSRAGDGRDSLVRTMASAFHEGHGTEDWCPLWHVVRAQGS